MSARRSDGAARVGVAGFWLRDVRVEGCAVCHRLWHAGDLEPWTWAGRLLDDDPLGPWRLSSETTRHLRLAVDRPLVPGPPGFAQPSEKSEDLGATSHRLRQSVATLLVGQGEGGRRFRQTPAQALVAICTTLSCRFGADDGSILAEQRRGLIVPPGGYASWQCLEELVPVPWS